mgnify:CR=1 FL=1
MEDSIVDIWFYNVHVFIVRYVCSSSVRVKSISKTSLNWFSQHFSKSRRSCLHGGLCSSKKSTVIIKHIIYNRNLIYVRFTSSKSDREETFLKIIKSLPPRPQIHSLRRVRLLFRTSDRDSKVIGPKWFIPFDLTIYNNYQKLNFF